MAIVKKLKQHPPLPPSRYEVGIYCRVSTASKTQVVSAGHQLSGLISDVANSHQARLYDVLHDYILRGGPEVFRSSGGQEPQDLQRYVKDLFLSVYGTAPAEEKAGAVGLIKRGFSYGTE